MILLLEALATAIVEQPINGCQFQIEQDEFESSPPEDVRTSFFAVYENWGIYIKKRNSTLIISGANHYANIPIDHPQLIEETLKILHTMVQHNPTYTGTRIELLIPYTPSLRHDKSE